MEARQNFINRTLFVSFRLIGGSGLLLSRVRFSRRNSWLITLVNKLSSRFNSISDPILLVRSTRRLAIPWVSLTLVRLVKVLLRLLLLRFTVSRLVLSRKFILLLVVITWLLFIFRSLIIILLHVVLLSLSFSGRDTVVPFIRLWRWSLSLGLVIVLQDRSRFHRYLTGWVLFILSKPRLSHLFYRALALLWRCLVIKSLFNLIVRDNRAILVCWVLIRWCLLSELDWM